MVYKKYLLSGCVIIFGVLLVLIAVFAADLGISDGPKDFFGPAQWLMIGVGVCVVIVGLFSRQISLIIIINLIVLLPLGLLVDNLLYWGSPWLPKNIVTKKLSKDAQAKYKLTHKEKPVYMYDGNIWFYNPSSNNPSYISINDEFGYRNLPGYISDNEKMDVVLLGSSFISGSSTVTITEYLREFLDPFKIYSLGIGGQGIPHWGLQFKRYVNSTYFKDDPKIVVLNFHGGFTTVATAEYTPGIPAHLKDVSNTLTWPERKFSRYGELMSIFRTVFRQVLAHFFPPVPLETEMTSDDLSKTFVEFSKVVNDIREVSPESIILLSYIPSVSVVYGQDEEYCSNVLKENFPFNDGHEHSCEVSTTRHEDNTKTLRNWAAQLKIHYLDSTPVVQKKNKDFLHLFNDPHFNEKGNRIYSEELAKKITTIIR